MDFKMRLYNQIISIKKNNNFSLELKPYGFLYYIERESNEVLSI